MGVVSERAWCVPHDRSAEFQTTDQERVCWRGLCDPEAKCRLALVTVEQKEGVLQENDTEAPTRDQLAADCLRLVVAKQAAEARLAQIAELSERGSLDGSIRKLLDEMGRIARDGAS